MQAVEISEPGGPDVLQLTERETPRPQAGEVLIENIATSVNRLDVFQREGNYPLPPGVTDIPGLDASGRVVAVGAGVTQVGVGDAVCALLAGGSYAEYCVAPAGSCLPIPDGLDFIQAAALPETFFTVWSNVFDRGGLQAGETLLVHGGTSGIGTTAIQIATNLGATVFTTAGSAEKCALCEELGATRAINYREEDFVAVVKETTGGAGVNVILDMVGGEYLARNIDALAVDGRLVQIALLGGSDAKIKYAQVMLKRLTITGSTLRGREPEFKEAIANRLLEKVWPLLEQGKVRPIIETVLPLARAGDAHRLLVSGENRGKIVLRVRDTA
jgi:putative PIG3 family NAD(P)H quinone oxidoreductase